MKILFKRRGKRSEAWYATHPNPKSSAREIAGRHGHRPHGPSILWPALYEHLRRKGHSKASAAAISNAGWKKKRVGIPTNTPTSARGFAKAQPGPSDVHTPQPLKVKRGKKRSGKMAEIAGVRQLAMAKIAKVNEDKKLVFGWAYVTHDNDGELNVDESGEFVDDYEEVEKAAYKFMLESRDGDDAHNNVATSHAVESVFFSPEKTQAMGIPDGTVPTGWWVGFKVEDDDVWDNVKKGRYTSFSIHGTSSKQQVEDEGDVVVKSGLSSDFALAGVLRAGPASTHQPVGEHGPETVVLSKDAVVVTVPKRPRRFAALRRRRKSKVRVYKREVSLQERHSLEGKGHTFRGTSYPIKNASDLSNAIQAYGRSKPGDRAALKSYLLKEARRLKASEGVITRINSLGSSNTSKMRRKKKVTRRSVGAGYSRPRIGAGYGGGLRKGYTYVLGPDFSLRNLVSSRDEVIKRMNGESHSLRIYTMEYGDDKGKICVDTTDNVTRIFDDIDAAFKYAKGGGDSEDVEEVESVYA